MVRLPAPKISTDFKLSERDRRIVELAFAKVNGVRVDFNEAVRALREAAEELIAGGRVFFLGVSDAAPIVGSIVSGVGIVERASGIQLVRVHDGGGFAPIGWFSR